MGLLDKLEPWVGRRTDLVDLIGSIRAEIGAALRVGEHGDPTALSTVPFEVLPGLAPRSLKEDVAAISERALSGIDGREALLALDRDLQRIELSIRRNKHRRARFMSIGLALMAGLGALATWSVRRAQPLRPIALEAIAPMDALTVHGFEALQIDPAWKAARLDDIARWYFGRVAALPSDIARDAPEHATQLRLRLQNPSHGAAIFVSLVRASARLREARDLPWADMPIDPAPTLTLEEGAVVRFENKAVGPVIDARWRSRAGALEVASGTIGPLVAETRINAANATVGHERVSLANGSLTRPVFVRLEQPPTVPDFEVHVRTGPEPAGPDVNCDVQPSPGRPTEWWLKTTALADVTRVTAVAHGAELAVQVDYHTLRGKAAHLKLDTPHPGIAWYEGSARVARDDPRCGAGPDRDGDGLLDPGGAVDVATKMLARDDLRKPSGSDVVRAQVSLDLTAAADGRVVHGVDRPTAFLNGQGQLAVDIELGGGRTGIWAVTVSVGEVEHGLDVEILAPPPVRFAQDIAGETKRLRALLAPRAGE